VKDFHLERLKSRE